MVDPVPILGAARAGLYSKLYKRNHLVTDALYIIGEQSLLVILNNATTSLNDQSSPKPAAPLPSTSICLQNTLNINSNSDLNVEAEKSK